MIDASGRPQSVLILGGTSDIAWGIMHALPGGRLARVVLAGRDPATLSATADREKALLTTASGEPVTVETVLLDAVDTAGHAAVLDDVFDRGDIDLTILAVGRLGDQQQAQTDPHLAVALANDTYVGPLSLMLHVGRRLRHQGHGTLVVLSSVAARQARSANYLYGSAKAGLDLAALGLGDSLHGTGARVLVVRPGFVRTRMTAHLKVPPLAVDADAVGRAVVSGLRQGRSVTYAPPAAQLVAAALTVLPRTVLRRLPF